MSWISSVFPIKGDYSLQVSECIEKASLEDSTLYTFLQSVQQVVEK